MVTVVIAENDNARGIIQFDVELVSTMLSVLPPVCLAQQFNGLCLHGIFFINLF